MRQFNKELCVDFEYLSFEEHSKIDRIVYVNSCQTELLDNLVITSRSENSQKMLDRPSCWLKKISSAIVLNCSIVNVMFAIINHGGTMMNKKIEISAETDALVRRNGKMGETHDDVIRRGFAYLDSCSEFWNEE